jgi:hypothetical protein
VSGSFIRVPARLKRDAAIDRAESDMTSVFTRITCVAWFAFLLAWLSGYFQQKKLEIDGNLQFTVHPRERLRFRKISYRWLIHQTWGAQASSSRNPTHSRTRPQRAAIAPPSSYVPTGVDGELHLATSIRISSE